MIRNGVSEIFPFDNNGGFALKVTRIAESSVVGMRRRLPTPTGEHRFREVGIPSRIFFLSSLSPSCRAPSSPLNEGSDHSEADARRFSGAGGN